MKTINQLINFAWTILAFSIVVIYWAQQWNLPELLACLAVSFASIFIPLRCFRFAKDRKSYERAGILIAGQLVQNGGLVNRIRRRHDPGFRVIRMASMTKFLRESVVYERYHLICLFFFLGSAIDAIVRGVYMTGLLIVLSNVIYNVYPVLLQQYYRLRVDGISARREIATRHRNA